MGHDSVGTLPQAGPQLGVCPCCSRSRSSIDRILSGAALPLRLLIHPLPTAFDSRPSSRLGSRTEGVAAFLSCRGTRVSSHRVERWHVSPTCCPLSGCILRCWKKKKQATMGFPAPWHIPPPAQHPVIKPCACHAHETLNKSAPFHTPPTRLLAARSASPAWANRALVPDPPLGRGLRDMKGRVLPD